MFVSEHDLMAVINFFYNAFNRSRITLCAQDAALQHLSASWHAWQNIAQRRRNPSKKLPYPQSSSGIEHSAIEFQSYTEQHDTIASLYTVTSELIFKENILENKLLLAELEYVHELSRSTITHALLDVQSHVAELATFISKHRAIQCDDESEPYDNDLIHTRSLLSYIKEQAPIFAFNSFVKTDNGFIKASEYNWSALVGAQEISTIIWKAIETARARFYLTYYREAYRRSLAAGIVPYKLFDTDGIIPLKSVRPPLPSPEYIEQFQFID